MEYTKLNNHKGSQINLFSYFGMFLSNVSESINSTPLGNVEGIFGITPRISSDVGNPCRCCC